MRTEPDIASWIKDLAGDDDKLAGSARRRLVARGRLVAEPLLAALNHPLNVSQYRGSLRVLGDIASEGALSPVAPVRALLLDHLKNHDNAERRSIITCLGRLGVDSEAESALLNLWTHEKRDDQLRVLAVALGKVGGERSEVALKSCVSNASLVLREIATASAALSTRRARAVVGEGRVLGEKILTEVPLRLRCRRGLGELLLRNLPHTVRGGRETFPGQIDAQLHGSLDSLLDCRLWSDAVLLAEMPPKAGAPESFAAALGKVSGLLRDLTEGAPIWRLQLPNASRGQLLDFVRAAQRVAPELPNSPNRAVWELRPIGNVLEIIPRFWRDTRFNYLRAEVPAMTHAPLAAAMAVLSEPHASDIVWDPFCGAGTELVERAKAGPYAKLIGSDRDPAAIAAATENLNGIDRLTLREADALTWPEENVNVLLTNPPYGRKVQGGNPIRLLRMLLENASRQMRRGRIVICSPMPAETWDFVQRLGWSALTRFSVSKDENPLELQVFLR
ncbi:MAG TPA: methyltransferase domain-containing protein [Verrucomicrobiae bacterium]